MHRQPSELRRNRGSFLIAKGILDPCHFRFRGERDFKISWSISDSSQTEFLSASFCRAKAFPTSDAVAESRDPKKDKKNEKKFFFLNSGKSGASRFFAEEAK